MQVYDKEKTDPLEAGFNEPAIADEDRNTGQTPSPDSSSEVHSLNYALKKPAIADEDRNTNSQEENYGTDQENDDDFYNPQTTGRKGKKKGIIGGIISIIVAGSLFFGSMQLPNLIINHLREVILGNLSSVQLHNTRKYRRTKLNKIKDLFSKDGRKAGAIANELEQKGYKVAIDKKTGKLFGITPPGSNVSLTGATAAEHVEDFIEIKHPLRSARWKTKRMDAFYDYYKISRASPVPKTNKLIEDPDIEINKTIASDIIDKEPKIKVKTSSDSGDEAAEIQKNENKILAEGTDSLDDLQGKILKGVPEEKLLPEEKGILKIGNESIDNIAMETAENVAKKGSIGGKVFNSVKSVGNSAELLDKLCTIKNTVTAATLAARIYRSRALLKYASIFIKASDSTRTGNVDPKLMNSLMKRVTAKDRNGYTIGESPGFAYALKNKFSKNKNNAFKGNFGVDGKSTGFVAEVQNITDKAPAMGENQCGTYQNPAFQIGASGVDLTVAFFTAGSSKAATTTAEKGITEGVKKVVSRTISRQIAKKVAKQALKQVAIEVSFQGIITLMQIYVQSKLSIPFTGQEKGGMLGNILIGGGGVLNKQRSFKAGQIPATKKQYAQAQAEYYAFKKEENRKRSFWARNFDYSNSDSLAFRGASLLFSVPQSPKDITNTIASTLGSFSSSFFNIPHFAVASVSKGFVGTTYAEATDEISTETLSINGKDLVTDPAGNFLTILPNDILNIDPEENIQYLKESGDIDENNEPIGEEFKEHIENCVESIDTISILEKKDQSDPRFDCLASQSITKRYKAHLAYLDMIDGLSATVNTDTNSNITANTNDPMFNKNPSVNVDGAPPGAHKSSNCTGAHTPGAESLGKVIKEKWSLVSSVGGYVCRQNTASPGTSIHGLGRAMDVMIDSTNPLGLAQGNEIRNWVINNSTQLGVQRVIWNRYSWSANKDGWNSYSGPNPHTDHLHIEINLSVANNGNLGK